MQDEKLYLQPELNLSDIANRLKTNISVLSGVVNNAFGKNFNDFVNEYRVKEFQERITILAGKKCLYFTQGSSAYFHWHLKNKYKG